MVTEISLPYSQDPANGPHHEPDDFSPVRNLRVQ